MRSSWEIAYAQTLQGYHNFLERQAFRALIALLPGRQHFSNFFSCSSIPILGWSCQEVSFAKVKENDPTDLTEFVQVGQRFVSCCYELDKELSGELAERRSSFAMDEAYGRT